MTTANDLLYAFLSMDAYNRGYGAGLSDTGASDDPDGLGYNRSMDGAIARNHQDFGIDAAKYQEWQDAGFYAVAYDTPDGIVISYRGNCGDSYRNHCLTSAGRHPGRHANRGPLNLSPCSGRIGAWDHSSTSWHRERTERSMLV